MADKLDMIKGLEDAIQTYLAQHEGAKVTVEYSRDAHEEDGAVVSSWFCWKVKVTHQPKRL